MDRFKVENMISISGVPETAKETAIQRKEGLNSATKIGKAYYMPPGMGVSSASTSIRSSMQLIRINKLLRYLAEYFLNDENNFISQLKSDKEVSLDLHIALSKEGLCIYERNTNQAFIMPRTRIVGSGNWLAELHDLILPEWAHNYLMQKNGLA